MKKIYCTFVKINIELSMLKKKNLNKISPIKKRDEEPKKKFSKKTASSSHEKAYESTRTNRSGKLIPTKNPLDKPKGNFSKKSETASYKKDDENTRKNRFDKFIPSKNSPDKPKQNFADKKSGSKKKEQEGVRLNKYIASSGICSRREADEQIKLGLVTINGKIIIELGTRVLPGDVVKYDQSVIKDEKKVYILLNKPKDVITSAIDESNRMTVLDLLKGKVKARVYPVGRLDKNTTGVLLITNDGDLTKQLTHPKHNKKKIYHVVLDKNLLPSDMAQLTENVELEDGPMFFDSISYVNPATKSEVGVEIHSGKNRVVRRMFEALGYRVLKLDRVYFAGLTKKNLARGKWRFLTEQEISMLKMGAYE